MKTMQGIESRRRAVRGLFARAAAYTVLYVLLASTARLLVGDQLSAFIADATSVWVEVPEESADLYRLLGYQEGSTVNGNPQFRDLRDYHGVVAIIEGPVLWGIYAVGLLGVSAWWAASRTREVDELTHAVGRAAAGEQGVLLPPELTRAQDEFDRLVEHEEARGRAVEAAEARKNELVAYLAHDIRTPLTSVIGYLSLLADEPDLPRDRRERYVCAAFEKAQRLDGMMGEFFEITRYNLGAIPIEREHVDVRLLLEQVADEVFPLAEERGVAIDLEVPEGTAAFIDPDKMARVLGNLMKNGIAYADAGTALVCRARTEGERLVLEVEDTGREISPAHLKSIFEKFYREDGARSGKGAGLGLAIAREIVEAHGGSIEAASDAGVTTFTVALPR